MPSDLEVGQSFRHDINLFVTGLAISLVAKGIALFPFGRSVDSYPKLIAMSVNPSESAGVFNEFVAQGRVGQWALNKVLEALGIIGPGGNTLYVFLALCCFVAVGVLLCRLWRLENNRLLQVCVVGIFAIHPYHAETFTFREMTLCVGLALLLGIVGLIVTGRRLSRWIAGWALLMISLSLYQVAFNYVVMALIVLCLLEISKSGETRMLTESPVSSRQWFLQDVAMRASAIVTALVTYLAFRKLSLQFVVSASSSRELDRAAIIPLSWLPERLYDVIHTLWRIFAVSEPLMPKATKVMIVVLSMLAVGVLGRKILETRDNSRYLKLALACGLLGAALVTIMGVLIPLADWCAIDRTLAAVSVLVAGLLAIVCVNGGIGIRRFALAVAFVLLFSFAGVNNVVLSEQLRVNSRDLATANRMIAQLEANPAFSSVKKIAVIGSKREYPLHFYTTKKKGSDVNISAFARPWSKANLLREVSGYRFIEPSTQVLDQAKDYCCDAQPWPDPTSVTMLNDTAVVCLSAKQ